MCYRRSVRELRTPAALVCILLSRAAIAEDLPPPPPPPELPDEAAPAPGPSGPGSAEPAWIVPAPQPPATPPPPRKPRRRRILISDFRTGENVAADLGRTLAGVAVREASQLEGYQVITKADLVARLGTEHGRQMLGCAEDGTCLAELAGALDAEQSLGGTVAATADGVLLTLTLVDMRQVTTIRSRSETLRGLKVDDLVDATRRIAYEVISGRPFDLTGTLDIEVAERDTSVFVDEEEVGAGPYRGARRVAPGQYRVAILRGEKVLFSTDVRVEAAGRTTVRPNLDPTSVEVLKPLPWGGPYYYGVLVLGPSNLLAIGKRGDCPSNAAGFGSGGGDEGCNMSAALRVGIGVMRYLAFEAWAERDTAGWLSAKDGGWYAHSETTLFGLAAVVRFPYFQALGLRAGAGVGQASYKSWGGNGNGSAAVGSPTRGSNSVSAGSLDVVLAPRWGPVRFEISVAVWGFDSGTPSQLVPVGVAAPYIFKYQPLHLGIGVIFPREPSRESRRAKDFVPATKPAPAPPDETYRPPGT